jgi:asparagine synthase (glutamine-hydrolysing)
MYLLSELVRQNHYKVVLTGEGADEFLAGYDIFKEVKIRRFWARQRDSKGRSLLLQRLYPDITALPNSSTYLASFFGEGLEDVDQPDYSHAIRWRTTRRAKRFFSDELRHEVEIQASLAPYQIPYPDGFMSWQPLSRAQWLEVTIFLSQYLLSSQGDRPAMAHSVEGRYPFLDYRVVEFCERLPPALKLLGLNEKYLLKRLSSKWLPAEIWQRPKRPYRAPIHRSFINTSTPDYVLELTSPDQIISKGMFKPGAVSQLVNKVQRGMSLSETDDMALAGIISTQLVHELFVSNFKMPAPTSTDEDMKVCVGFNVRQGVS